MSDYLCIYIYVCVVLFVVSKILDSSGLLPGMYQRRTAVWEGRGATARPREAKCGSGDAAVFT